MSRLLAGVAAGAVMCAWAGSAAAADLPGKFEGVTVDAKLIGGQQYEALYARIAEWEQATGAKVNVLSKKNHFELDKEIKSDIATGNITWCVGSNHSSFAPQYPDIYADLAALLPKEEIDAFVPANIAASTLDGKLVMLPRAQFDVSALYYQKILYEDPKVFVLDKPSGLAVQGGSGVTRSVDSMLEALRNAKGEKPRLVHRLDRDTSGVLVIARTRLAAMKLAEAFRGRDAKKTYWALVKGVPKKREDKISTWLVKEQTPDGDRMRVARHGEPGADHAVTHYRVVEQAGQALSWLEMEPYTGRTHQLRVHAAHIGHPMIGDPKYFEADQNWEFPGGIQNRLHLHARRIVIPHPDGGRIDVTAPLPPHMRQSWNLLGFDEALGDG